MRKQAEMVKKNRKLNVQMIFLKGKRICFDEVCVHYMDCEENMARIAFICGKKKIHLATKRNKARRQMREGVQRIKGRILKNKDMVLVFTGKTIMSSEQVFESVEKVLFGAGLLKNND